MMVEAGLLTEEAARTHPMSNVLEMALGVEDFVAPEICSKPIDLERGDRFVLCSDGLWGLVKDEELLELFQEGDLRGCGGKALEMALNRGAQTMSLSHSWISRASIRPRRQQSRAKGWFAIARIFYYGN